MSKAHPLAALYDDDAASAGPSSLIPPNRARADQLSYQQVSTAQRTSKESLAFFESLQAQRAALGAAIQQDKIVLDSIHKYEVEVTKRMKQRANLLQTLQAKEERECGASQQASYAPGQQTATLCETQQKSITGKEDEFSKLDATDIF